jgi:hypothetical protein
MPEEQDTGKNQPETPIAPSPVISPGALSTPDQTPNSPTSPEIPLTPPQPELVASEEQSSYDSPNDPGPFETVPTPSGSPSPTVTWTASEFIAHDKEFSWYLRLGIATIIFAALIYLLNKSIVSLAVIVVAALVFGLYAGRKPRQLEYRLDRAGLTIGNKLYAYEQFKSFSVLSTGAFSCINFMPLKRFSPILSVYYSPQDEKNIMLALSTVLPYEEPRRDMVDSLMRRIRF